MRILHLLDAPRGDGAPEGAAAAIALLQRDDPGNDHHVIAMLPVEAATRVREMGVRLDARLGIASLRKRSALNALAPALRRLDPIDRVQPWSRESSGLASSIGGSASVLPPAPSDPPIAPSLLGAFSRGQWRERFGIGAEEIALSLLDLDPERSSAGDFGLAIPPLTCAIQDRTIVGLIPGAAVGDGATRAARYAKNASDVWRIECVTAPMYGVVAASDAVLCPSPLPLGDRWQGCGTGVLALRCARLLGVPIVSGTFDPKVCPAPIIHDAHRQLRSGRVGIVTALFEALTGSASAQCVEDAAIAERFRDDAQRWLERWRSRAMDRVGV